MEPVELATVPGNKFGLRSVFFELSTDAFDGIGGGFEFAHEGFEDPHGGAGDMMLHPFDIIVNGLVVDTEELQEAGKKFVATDDVVGDFFSAFGEGHATVFLVVHEAFAIEPLHHVSDAGLGLSLIHI